jgi:hypothetical protein
MECVVSGDPENTSVLEVTLVVPAKRTKDLEKIRRRPWDNTKLTDDEDDAGGGYMEVHCGSGLRST